MKNPGRFAGLIYVLVFLPDVFTLVYLRSNPIVRADSRQTFFRLNFSTEIVSQIAFIWVVLLLYDLLKQTNRRQAEWMFGLAAIQLPIVLLNAMFFLYFPNRGFRISSIFSGLWLFPLGLLVYHSPQFSRIAGRILGVLLIADCCSYFLGSLTSLAAPKLSITISFWIAPLRFGELIFMLALLILGTKSFQDQLHT